MSEVLERDKYNIKVLSSVQRLNGYDILEIETGYAKILFRSENAQTYENSNVIFEGELYKAANFAALIAINEENTFVINSHVDFLSQVEVDVKEIVFEAKAVSSSLGKKFLEVKASVDDILLFLGNFTILKMDARSKIKI